MFVRMSTLLAAFCLVACGGEATPPAQESTATRGVVVDHATRVGRFQVAVPDGYMSLQSEEAVLFGQIQQQALGGLQLVDMFIERSDLPGIKLSPPQLRHPAIQLQLFPPDAPPVSDAMWPTVRQLLPGQMTGSAGRANVRQAAADFLQRQASAGTGIMSADMGEIVVYQNTDDGIRWFTTVQAQRADAVDATRLVVATAARRIGNQLYMLSSSSLAGTESDARHVVGALDQWLAGVRATAR